MTFQTTAHKSNTKGSNNHMNINHSQCQPFDEIMFDEIIAALRTPMETCETKPKAKSPPPVPYDEERAAPAYVSPCPSQESATVASLPAVTDQFIDIEAHYLIDPTVLGAGHHGSVRQCIHRQTGKRYAVKSICKSHPTVKIPGLAREVSLLKEMKHKSILQLVDVYEDEDYLHLVTELCHGGELFGRIVEKSNQSRAGCFTEKEAARLLYQILNAVSYLHQNNCVHRDIKPENILFETKDEDSPIKIIDFGLARKHYGDLGEPPMTTIVGTPYYMSPDVLKRSYDKACDMWSIGVIAYVLLAGYPPFNGRDNKEVYGSIKKGMYYFPTEDWQHVSNGAKNFIVALLQRDPQQRMTVEQAMRHPWLLKNLAMFDLQESRDAVEVVHDRTSKKDSVLFKGMFRPRVKIL